MALSKGFLCDVVEDPDDEDDVDEEEVEDEEEEGVSEGKGVLWLAGS